MALDLVDEKAAQLLQAHRVKSAPVPVEQIALAEGIKVARSAAEWSESGFLLRDGTNTIIGVNSRNSRRRQRFTIAHELGHWSLHEGRLIVDQSVRINKRDEVSSQATDRQEIEANRFAAHVLMPDALVFSAVKQLMRTGVGSRDELITTLARDFDVSNDAMGYRLINLGLLSS